MNCAEVRLAIGAAPHALDEQVQAHLVGCPECSRFRDEMLALEGDIARALALGPPLPQSAVRPTPGVSPPHVDPPPTPAAPPPLARVIPLPPTRVAARHAPSAWRPWAMAASLLLAVALGTALWLARPADTLAHDVVVHVRGEPDSWLEKERVSAAGIDHALRANGVELGIRSDRITYAQSCWFRGHYIPHLIVQTETGPVTVLILKHEQVRGARRFSEQDLSGVIVPASQAGSIAVVAPRGSVAAGRVAQTAAQMQHETQWLGSGQ